VYYSEYHAEGFFDVDPAGFDVFIRQLMIKKTSINKPVTMIVIKVV
jgi:hypothetical protein